MGAWLRDETRKNDVNKQREDMQEMFPIQVAAGGKCKITVWMTAEQLERERKSR